MTGAPLLLPKPFVTKEASVCTSEEIRELSKQMTNINFNELSEGNLHSVPKVYILKDLQHCTNVWIRVDRVRRALFQQVGFVTNVLIGM